MPRQGRQKIAYAAFHGLATARGGCLGERETYGRASQRRFRASFYFCRSVDISIGLLGTLDRRAPWILILSR
jgi:hypothetical protein